MQPPGDRTFQVEGTASFSCARFTILGAGHDIWDPADAFHYVYKSIESGAVSLRRGWSACRTRATGRKPAS